MAKRKMFPVVVTTIDYETILPVWTNLLWPGRVTPIRPVSTMMLLGGYDMSILTKYIDDALFFGVFDTNGDIAGVFSGHPTSDRDYRGRGLYVRPDAEQQGIGTALVEAVVNMASTAGRDICWSLPRVPNVPFFQSCGFVPMSGPTSEGMEFGPNVYMGRAIIPQ